MPKVSDAHRAARREQILQAAQRCVVRNGFHRTTMADVLAESGLSAGAVYIYFKSKEDLLEAIAGRALGSLDAVFDDLLTDGRSPAPAVALAAVLERLVATAGSEAGDVTVVAVQAWAEAALGGPVQQIVGSYMRHLRDYWVEVARRYQAAGGLAPDVDPELVGQVLLATMPGFVLQRLLIGDVGLDGFVDGLRALTAGASVDMDAMDASDARAQGAQP